MMRGCASRFLITNCTKSRTSSQSVHSSSASSFLLEQDFDDPGISCWGFVFRKRVYAGARVRTVISNSKGEREEWPEKREGQDKASHDELYRGERPNCITRPRETKDRTIAGKVQKRSTLWSKWKKGREMPVHNRRLT